MTGFLKELGLDPQLFLIAAALSAAVFIFAFRKFLFNVFDPLAVFILSMVASSTLVLALPWPDTLKVEFALFAFCFWLGFIKRGHIPKNPSVLHFETIPTFEFEVMLLTLFVIIFAGNIYVGFTSGFPLLSSDPSITKVTIYTGGMGAIKRLDMLPYVFFCSGSVFMAVVGHKRRLFLILLIIASIMIALTGSKGALASPVFVLAFVVSHPGLIREKSSLAERIKRYALLSLVVAITLALVIPIIDTGGVATGLMALMKRVIFYGDIVLYYFPVRDTLVSGTHPLDFPGYLFQSTLVMFRMIESSPSLGAVIMGSGEAGFGPNPQYFVLADLFFGPVFGCGYCLLIGYLIAWMRRAFFSFSVGSPVKLVLRLTIAVSAFTLATDAGLFVSQLIDLFLIVAPLWLIAHTITVAIKNGISRATVEYGSIPG